MVEKILKNGTRVIRGGLTFNASKLDVTDPCYKKSVWCRITVPIVPGKYNYQVRMRDGIWGLRVKSIRIMRKEAGLSRITYGEYVTGKENNPEGVVGVDSGTAGFLEDKPDYTEEDWSRIYKFVKEQNSDDTRPWIVEGHKDNPVKCEAIYTTSGYGDGTYYVRQLLDRDKQLCGYELRFL